MKHLTLSLTYKGEIKMNKQNKRNKVESTKQPIKAQSLCQVETDVRFSDDALQVIGNLKTILRKNGFEISSFHMADTCPTSINLSIEVSE